jgi:D-beta-D-heptose 7-phosphate kinase / D-beta-D-heptose 1-phosphate adenosyltransferase
MFLKLKGFLKNRMIELLNKSPKILVIGDLMIDHYLWGSSKRISPEAPVPVVKIDHESTTLGGAGNVVQNLQVLGAKIDLISIVGECSTSKDMLKLLKKINIDTKYIVKENGRLSAKKSRLISSQLQVARYDQETSSPISSKSEDKLLSILTDILEEEYDCILLSDYGKGLLTNKFTQRIIKLANKRSIKVLVDPKGLDYSKYKGAYLLTPNKQEASNATKIEIRDDQSLKSAIKALKNHCKLEISIITLSENGIAIFDNNFRQYSTSNREVFDVTGAGDTVLASLGFAISCSFNIDDSVKFANLAAGVVIGKIGSATASINEIINYESVINKSSSKKFIKDTSEIIRISKELKSNNNKIIFTNGCFDLIHFGHVKYLEDAKKYGDVLIVGLNSDSSVKKLKGDNRPINNQSDRALILAALEAVDYVVIFDDDTPHDLIKKIKPDVLVKGGDYKGKKVSGANFSKQLKLIDFIEGRSTSNLIEKINNFNSL